MTDAISQQNTTSPHIISAWGPELIGCLLLTQQGRVVLGTSKGLERLTTPDEDSAIADKLPCGALADTTAYPVMLLSPPLNPPQSTYELATRIESIEAERRGALEVVEQHTRAVEAMVHYSAGMTRSAIYAGAFALYVSLYPLTLSGALVGTMLALTLWDAHRQGTGALLAAMTGEVVFVLSTGLVVTSTITYLPVLEWSPILTFCGALFGLVAALKVGGALRDLVEARIKGSPAAAS